MALMRMPSAVLCPHQSLDRSLRRSFKASAHGACQGACAAGVARGESSLGRVWAGGRASWAVGRPEGPELAQSAPITCDTMEDTGWLRP